MEKIIVAKGVGFVSSYVVGNMSEAKEDHLNSIAVFNEADYDRIG